jgi:hypothetical protein
MQTTPAAVGWREEAANQLREDLVPFRPQAALEHSKSACASDRISYGHSSKFVLNIYDFFEPKKTS